MSILDHASLKALAKELGRPLYTLEVLRNDPFTAGVPAREAGAEWFAELYERLGIEPGADLRRIHYLLVSQDPPVRLPNGEDYINTEQCAEVLNRAALDARYLGLVDAGDLVDRRNDEPTINLGDEEEAAASVHAGGGLLNYEPPSVVVPSLAIIKPTIPQRYHIELWCEKTTMNDVLMPLGEQYGINVVTGSGELSLTHCAQLVERAEASGRPVRILYVADFDPAGASMPVAVARKIEHTLYQRALHDLDIQVRPIVLTHDQCAEYRLPRTPIKESETRAAAFEARFGGGATELDALEALHPGVLAQILEQEIARYHDADLDDRIEETADEVRDDLDAINTRIGKRHAKAFTALERERKKLLAQIAAFEKQARPVLRKIERDLEAEAPDVDDYDWPEPDEGDEDADPLFSSMREYLTQITAYKSHQGKPTESTRKPYTFRPAVCASCGKEFEATSRNVLLACSGKCCEKLRRKRAAPGPIPCVICGTPFRSIRGAVTCSESCRKKLVRRRGRDDE